METRLEDVVDAKSCQPDRVSRDPNRLKHTKWHFTETLPDPTGLVILGT